MKWNVPARGPHAHTPVFTVVGLSGTGKTTFLEGLIPALRAHGLRVAVVKHDAHSFQMDRPGKDTWRFAQAGADVVAISNRSSTAILEYPTAELSLDEVISRLPPADLILTEGYKALPNRKIEIHRKALGRPLLTPAEELAAVVTDEALEVEVPQLALDDFEGCAALILGLMEEGQD